ncbi:MAG TPA: hypothetical protein VL501_02005 [Pyrinomonadaceae bacterium]|nr:hypothetical protein [Pyrinomonadaceae bacterium]
MFDQLPPYVSIVFILTTALTVGFLLTAVKSVSLDIFPSRLLLFVLPFWIILTGSLAVFGFYAPTDTFPPRVALFGVLPAILFILLNFLFFRTRLIERLPLRLLTLLHVVRIPVELTLYWLAIGGLVPQVMTFAGRNFDILSGILAVAVYFLGFRGRQANKGILITFNIVGMLLLVNIVSIAILSMQTPLQQFGFDQPNRAVLYFPYIWLPTIIVPIVLFSHLAALWQLLVKKPA